MPSYNTFSTGRRLPPAQRVAQIEWLTAKIQAARLDMLSSDTATRVEAETWIQTCAHQIARAAGDDRL